MDRATWPSGRRGAGSSRLRVFALKRRFSTDPQGPPCGGLSQVPQAGGAAGGGLKGRLHSRSGRAAQPQTANRLPQLALALLLALAVGGCTPAKTRQAIAQLQDQPLDPDLDALKKTDPMLILYTESGRIQTGFKEVRGIAAGSRGIYAVGDKAVYLFSPEGKLLGATNLPDAPQCVAVDAAGKAFIGANDHVMVVGPAGTAAWSSLGANALITSIAVGKDSVWVADAGNRLVDRFSLDGRFLGSFGKRDSATGYPGLIVPSPHLDVAATASGNVLATNPGTHRVETHAPDGKMLSAWGRESPDIDGFCGCCNPTDIALFPDGSVVTSEKGLPRVKVYSSAGKFVGVVASADTFNENTNAISLAVRDGRVYVLDPFNKVIRVYMSKQGVKP